jgi:hypothetical protein
MNEHTISIKVIELGLQRILVHHSSDNWVGDGGSDGGLVQFHQILSYTYSERKLSIFCNA